MCFAWTTATTSTRSATPWGGRVRRGNDHRSSCCGRRSGYGSPNKAGHHDAHGAPLGEDEVAATKRNLGYPSGEPFFVDPAALERWRETRERGRRLQSAWEAGFHRYREAHPELAKEYLAFLEGAPAGGWDADLPGLSGRGPAEATRVSSGRALQRLASRIPNLIGGSADLGGSNKTDIVGAADLLPDTPGGRIVHFGVREHAMGGILNGLALHGGVRPFGGTFLIFSDYMRPSIRLAALMELPVTYVFTHDSIGLGEDGPTHQPIEHLMALRAIPNLMDLRPADAAETAAAWRMALGRDDGPSFLALTRQKVPSLPRDGMDASRGVARGAYVILEAGSGAPELILIGSGSEVCAAVEAREALEREGIPTRVVSMPSWFLFEREERAYREAVLPPGVEARISIEAGATLGWRRWVGEGGAAIGLDHFGASAPSERLFKEFGITSDAILSLARHMSAGSRR